MQKSSQIKPLVAIMTLIYNHEAYIRDALEGFVMQQTNFPFMAIVHDDASTDGSANIIREYAEKYPDIIKPIYETENQYSKHDGTLGNIMRNTALASGAKYIALCEGDDYWTDPMKLQKQVDFLESHPEYSMCFGNAIEHWENSTNNDKQFSTIQDRDYSGFELLEKWIVPTATVLYNAEVLKDQRFIHISNSGKLLAGDILLFLTCANYGSIRGFSDCFSVYRRLESGIVRSVMDKEPYKFMLHEITLGNGFPGKIRKHLKIRIAQRVIVALKEFKTGYKLDYKYVMRGFYFAPLDTIKLFLKYL